MLVYRTRLHQRLMEESEKGLFEAIRSGKDRWSHIAEDVVYDCQKYRAWESWHARSLVPIAESPRQSQTLAALRRFEVSLVHRRALIDTVREQKVVGGGRERLFRSIYGLRDHRNSVLAEHFQYQLAVASTLSTERLSDICRDPAGFYLLEKYGVAYRSYFWSFCRWNLNEEPLLADLLRLSMESAKFNADRLKDCLLAGRDIRLRERERPRLLA